MMENPETQIAQYLEPFDDKIVSLAQALRHFLLSETKPKYELVGDSTISVNIGYGFTQKSWDCYCAIIVYSMHINISFPAGASLPDPQGILQGAGKKIRHMKVKDTSYLKVQEVREILDEARSRALARAELSSKNFTTETIIKPIAGIKKRPCN